MPTSGPTRAPTRVPTKVPMRAAPTRVNSPCFQPFKDFPRKLPRTTSHEGVHGSAHEKCPLKWSGFTCPVFACSVSQATLGSDTGRETPQQMATLPDTQIFNATLGLKTVNSSHFLVAKKKTVNSSHFFVASTLVAPQLAFQRFVLKKRMMFFGPPNRALFKGNAASMT